mmetsp:Transcript_40734/g.110139  ORF Transcript_40734/g.110139 Transcript_40734/m.110139 type:complete len:282 (-) Transcript_40734:208-1053(-)
MPLCPVCRQEAQAWLPVYEQLPLCRICLEEDLQPFIALSCGHGLCGLCAGSLGFGELPRASALPPAHPDVHEAAPAPLAPQPTPHADLPPVADVPPASPPVPPGDLPQAAAIPPASPSVSSADLPQPGPLPSASPRSPPAGAPPSALRPSALPRLPDEDMRVAAPAPMLFGFTSWLDVTALPGDLSGAGGQTWQTLGAADMWDMWGCQNATHAEKVENPACSLTACPEGVGTCIGARSSDIVPDGGSLSTLGGSLSTLLQLPGGVLVRVVGSCLFRGSGSP